MTIEDIKEEDSLIIDITVSENGVVKDITGATVTAAIESPGLAGAITTVTATVQDGPNGIARVTVPKDKFIGAGAWKVQCRVELGAESRTIYHEVVEVGKSLLKDA